MQGFREKNIIFDKFFHHIFAWMTPEKFFIMFIFYLSQSTIPLEKRSQFSCIYDLYLPFLRSLH